MSILIKTMTKLPEHCYECPCHDGESGYCQADEKHRHRYSDCRPFWCPLVDNEKMEYKGGTISTVGEGEEVDITPKDKIGVEISYAVVFHDCGVYRVVVSDERIMITKEGKE